MLWGGGRGGQGVYTTSSPDGASGGASSFGSYVTAAGASAQIDAGGMVTRATNNSNYTAIGSDGEHGWGSALWRIPAWVPGIDIDIFNILNSFTGVGLIPRNAGATDKAINGSAKFNSSGSPSGGRGGLGYGAGGGGGAIAASTNSRAGSGGKAGIVKVATITLSSLSAIAVTVGTGGAGGTAAANGGAGANGCVAVFW